MKTIEGKCYFASDFHLGITNYPTDDQRESYILAWLDQVKSDGKHLFLLGDIFDFWFEYKYVIPKGYHRLLTKLEELRNAGVEIYYFTGNHDMWVKSYFTKQFGIQIFRNPQLFKINGKTVFVAHGDGLGPGQYRYKLIQWIFSRKINIFLYGLLPSSLAFAVAEAASRKSRKNDLRRNQNQTEYIELFIEKYLQNNHADLFIMGHRHRVIDKMIGSSRYINTGDWLEFYTYFVLESEGKLNYYLQEKNKNNPLP